MRDLYAEVTSKVIAAIEAGAGSWEMPWHAAAAGGHAVNHTTGAAYRGVNILMLGVSAAAGGYPVNQWASYKQWAAIGGQVRGGERGTMVVYAGQSVKPGEVAADGSEGEARRFNFLRCSSVFNVSQVDGVDLPTVERPSSVQRCAMAESLVLSSGAVVRFGFDRAYFSPTGDYIGMPDASAFHATSGQSATEGYYATLLHELTHWTGAPSRLDRDMARIKRFGDNAYGAEELVAEMGASFLCTRLGIYPEFRPDHARYLAGWVALMKADSRAIFTAAARASDAVEYLAKLQAADSVTGLAA